MKTSIHIKPVQPGSEEHNQRTKQLDYVRSELTHSNESYVVESISTRLEQIKALYERNTGQKMQKKATPIREGVVVIKPNTTMEQLQSFGKLCQERWGIKVLQIYTHKDEGHYQGKQWKPNLHAHIVFDWTDHKGKSCKLSKADMAEMQSILADCLEMERGISSDVQHLNAVQFKITQEEKKMQILQTKIALYPDYQEIRTALMDVVRKMIDLGHIKELPESVKKIFASVPKKEEKKPTRKRGFRM